MVSLTLPVAFSGAPGAWSEEAARRYFGPTRPTLTCANAREALEAVGEGRAAHAVVPIENTVTGRFPDLVEALFELPELRVAGEIALPVSHCLMGVPGARLDELAIVTSHPTALAHCRDYLANLGVATRAASDTGRAAEDLARERDLAAGVLGSRSLAERYGFSILAEGLSDVPDNRTRFYVLGREAAPSAAATRTAVLIGPVDRPRALKTLRITLESRGARRTRSPLLGAGDGRRFLVEFDHEPGRGESIACGADRLRVLGSWRP